MDGSMTSALFVILLSQTPPGAQLDAQVAELQTQVAQLQERIDFPQGVYDVTDYVPEGQEIADGFDLAQIACEDAGLSECLYIIPPGRHDMTKPIRLCMKAHVDAHGAQLFPVHSGAVIFGRDGAGCNSSGSTWQGGLLKGNIVSSTTTRPLPVGLDIQAPVSVRDVHVSSFARGVQAVCNNTGSLLQDEVDRGFAISENAHCNGVRLDNVSVYGNALDGFYFRGSDANAGLISMGSAVHNCMMANQWLPEGRDDDVPDDKYQCANFHDDSFLGNTWVAPHSSAAYDYRSTPGVNHPWFQYHSISANGRTTWIGPYAEGSPSTTTGNGRSYLKGYGHLVFGGLDNIEAPGGMTIGERGTVSRLQANASDGNISSQLTLGDAAGSGSVFRLDLDNGTYDGTLRLKPTESGWVRLDINNLNATQVLHMWLGDPAVRPLGTLRSLKGTLLPLCASTANGQGGWLDEANTVATSTDSVGVLLCLP
jgi:hypothetical protein